jgi:hypothetical protein
MGLLLVCDRRNPYLEPCTCMRGGMGVHGGGVRRYSMAAEAAGDTDSAVYGKTAAVLCWSKLYTTCLLTLKMEAYAPYVSSSQSGTLRKGRAPEFTCAV